jgi:hypothetical protein
MARLAAVAVLLALAVPARSDPQVDAAIHALRRDSSMKVRTQAAIVLGQRAAAEAVRPLREAVAEDDAAAVRIAAIAALAKLREPSARPTLELARDVDPDGAVRRAAERALAELGPRSFAIVEPRGPAAARAALREALSRHLADRGWTVRERGELRLEPTVKVDVDEEGGRTVIAVRTSLVLVDGDGRVDLLESSAKASVSGAVPEGKVAAYASRAIDAAARTLCEDLAARLGGR